MRLVRKAGSGPVAGGAVVGESVPGVGAGVTGAGAGDGGGDGTVGAGVGAGEGVGTGEGAGAGEGVGAGDGAGDGEGDEEQEGVRPWHLLWSPSTKELKAVCQETSWQLLSGAQYSLMLPADPAEEN